MRARLQAIAADTVAILSQGGYQAADGRHVRIADELRDAVAGTRLVLPGDALDPPERGPTSSARIEVTGETTLAAAGRLAETGDGQVACLNFASATRPGGGFLAGAQAQEESLARSSGLYSCLCAVPAYYAFHREHRDLLYSDRVIYSPAVPVFRDDHGGLLARPRMVAVLTAAAPNTGAIARDQPASLPDVSRVVRARAGQILAVAAHHRHRRLVLGAWGCGVFGNDPGEVAAAFAAHLGAGGGAHGLFTHVVFAIHDRAPGGPALSAFTRAFAARGG